MPDFNARLKRAYDLSNVKDDRFRGAGFSVTRHRARCSTVLCEALVAANTDHGGKSPYPYGLFFLEGDLSIVSEPPASLRGVSLVEIVPADTEDPRAAKLTWNQSGTEATFSFAGLSNLWGIEPPEGAALWFDAQILTDTDGLPVILVPLGQHIQTAAVQSRGVAAAQEQVQGDQA